MLLDKLNTINGNLTSLFKYYDKLLTPVPLYDRIGLPCTPAWRGQVTFDLGEIPWWGLVTQYPRNVSIKDLLHGVLYCLKYNL